MTERYAYTSDAWGRPLTVGHKLDNASQWTQLHAYAYDGAGRLVMDSRNGDTDLVTRYSYNVRSAVTEIKAGGTNASAMDWKVGSNGIGFPDESLRLFSRR